MGFTLFDSAVAAVKKLIRLVPGGIIAWADDGSGGVQYPAGDGSLITGVSVTETDPTALKIASNLSDVNSAATSRTNLGLGTAAVENVGTGANNVVQLDGTAKLPAVDGSQLTNLPASGGPSIFDATVAPSGADYTTVKNALDGGARTILVTGSVTDSVAITFAATADVTVWIAEGVTWTLSGVALTDAANAVNFAIKSLARAGTFAMASSASINFTGAGRLSFESVELDTTANGAVSGDILAYHNYLRDTRFVMGNQEPGAIKAPNNNYNLYIDNCEYVGGGTSCKFGIVATDAFCRINNLLVTGSFASAAFDFAIDVASSEAAETCHVSNLFFDTSTNVQARLGGLVESVGRKSGVDLTVTVLGNHSQLDNVYCDTLDLGSASRSKVSNCRVQNTFDMSDAALDAVHVVDSRMSSAVTIAGDGHTFSGVHFLSGATVSSGADDNGFSNCLFGDVLVGGMSHTLTITAGANRTRVVGCALDAALSDSGTGTEAVANTEF